MIGGNNEGNATYTTHLESTVELCHLLGVIPLRYPYTLLRLLCLGLHIFAHGNELVDCSFKCADKRFGVECYNVYVQRYRPGRREIVTKTHVLGPLSTAR